MALYLTAIFLIFIVIMTLILTFIPIERISLIGDFFKKVIPTIPISKIFK